MPVIFAILSKILGKNSENGSVTSKSYGITNNQVLSNSDISNLAKKISSPRRDNDTIFSS